LVVIFSVVLGLISSLAEPDSAHSISCNNFAISVSCCLILYIIF
jgi:hypothetical protein